MITIELSKQARAEAIASIQRYFRDEMPEPIGELPAGLLLNFFLEEIGPAIYNKAIADAQARLLGRVSDLNGELYADDFQFWIRVENKRKNRRLLTWHASFRVKPWGNSPPGLKARSIRWAFAGIAPLPPYRFFRSLSNPNQSSGLGLTLPASQFNLRLHGKGG